MTIQNSSLVLTVEPHLADNAPLVKCSTKSAKLACITKQIKKVNALEGITERFKDVSIMKL